KPKTGMIRQATVDLGVAASRSYVVGDQVTDMELAARSGAKGIWIHTLGEPPIEIPQGAEHVVASLWEAARWIPAAD
ncbi:MAG TPA: HAD hydrolase-like protein, partial [Candidatus Binatia bacterium]